MRSAKAYFQNTLSAIVRQVNAWRRPSKTANKKRLQAIGESIDTIRIRELGIDDIATLASIHVKTWNETYARGNNGPSIQLRESQWREKFRKKDDSWFILGVENTKGEMIGFAVGQKHNSEEYKGEINKIYLLQEYQRLGIGSKLLREVVRRFQQMGINSMVLFGIPQNPTGGFHEAMGGKRLYDKQGVFHGGYGWKEISALAEKNDRSK
jgi:ribosomal protein S18 acetylase RimI-like enzyme